MECNNDMKYKRHEENHGEFKRKILRWRLLKDMGGISKGNRRVGKKGSKKDGHEGGGNKSIKEVVEKSRHKKGTLQNFFNFLNEGAAMQISGSSSTYYGNHREESDIRRRNARQWEFMEKDVNDNFC